MVVKVFMGRLVMGSLFFWMDLVHLVDRLVMSRLFMVRLVIHGLVDRLVMSRLFMVRLVINGLVDHGVYTGLSFRC